MGGSSAFHARLQEADGDGGRSGATTCPVPLLAACPRVARPNTAPERVPGEQPSRQDPVSTALASAESRVPNPVVVSATRMASRGVAATLRAHEAA